MKRFLFVILATVCAADVAQLVLYAARPHVWYEEHDGVRVLRSPSGAQTISLLDGGSTGRYYESAALAAKYAPSLTPRVTLLGLGGGEMLRVLRRTSPGASLTAVDNDPAVIEIAEGKFGIARELRVDVVQANALQWVRLLEPQSWDAIIVDLYEDSSMVALDVPFFMHCWAALRPGGVMLVNVNPPAKARAVADAMRRTGFTVWSDMTWADDGNVILVAKR